MSVSLAFPRATGISQFAPSTKRLQSRTGNFHCRRDDYGGRIRAKLLLPAAPPTHLPPPPILPLKPSPAPTIPTPSRKETTTGDDEDIRRDVGGKLMAWTSIKQERWEGELEVQGEIPSWLHGIYLRNGPGKWNIEDYNFRHLFDGYATLIKLHFHPNKKVTGAHRQIESDAYKSAMANKKVCYREFSESPPKPNNNNSNKAAELISYYFQQLTGLLSGSSLTDNPNTGVIQLGDGRVVCLTETQKGSIVIDPETLDTEGRFEYDDGLGSGMYLLHSAHPIVTESEFLTLVPDLVRPGYVVARMTLHEKKNSNNNNNKRKVVGRVECRGGPGPGWVHSFAVTENYIIVPEMPLRYSAGNLLREIPTPLYKFGWHPESKAFMHVMCRKTGKLVASVEVPLFVTFHFINAYEKKDVDGRVTAIIADCCEHYADPGILDKLKLHNLRNFNGQDVLPDARVGRFTIPMDGSPYGSLEPALDPNQHGRGMDMCSINPSFLGKNYRYAYACGARRPCNFPNTITKIDLVNKTAKSWHEEGAIPSEPFFVARPGAEKEDDGVVISLVSDRNGEGYAVLLDASNFKEIARAKFPYGLPYGLHGCWIPL